MTSKEDKGKETSSYSFVKDEGSKSKAGSVKHEKSKDVIGREGKSGSGSSHEDHPRTKNGIKHSSSAQTAVDTEKVKMIHFFSLSSAIYKMINKLEKKQLFCVIVQITCMQYRRTIIGIKL